jgi:FkbM family methyltransferase
MREYASLQMRLDSLCLVKNEPDVEGEFTCEVPGTSDQKRLCRSGFNIAWLHEFGIVPKVIFDIGAYDGGDSIRFKEAFREACVISFEADPVRYPIVFENVDLFGIKAVNSAVCESDNPVQWYQSRYEHLDGNNVGGQGSLFRHSMEFRREFDFIRQSEATITVKGTRIDTFCRESGIDQIDLAHIDVEGAEYEVVCGLGSARPKMIYLETASERWIGAKDAREVHRKLSSMAYVLAADLPGNRLYIRTDVARCPS